MKFSLREIERLSPLKYAILRFGKCLIEFQVPEG